MLGFEMNSCIRKSWDRPWPGSLLFDPPSNQS
jgi:hypothetical protein